MKKTVSIACAVLMTLSFSACNVLDNNSAEDNSVIETIISTKNNLGNTESAANAITAISKLKKSSTITISGDVTATDTANMRTALQKLSASSPAITVTLDLTNAEFPKKTIPTSAFTNCPNLVGVLLPSTLVEIGKEAFKNTKLSSIKFPRKLATIGNGSFENCTSLKSITFDENIKTLDEKCFNICTSLTNITFKGTVAQWSTVSKNASYNGSVPTTIITCSDGITSF